MDYVRSIHIVPEPRKPETHVDIHDSRWQKAIINELKPILKFFEDEAFLWFRCKHRPPLTLQFKDEDIIITEDMVVWDESNEMFRLKNIEDEEKIEKKLPEKKGWLTSILDGGKTPHYKVKLVKPS